MAAYVTDVEWKLTDGEDFLAGRYSRGHHLTFDGGIDLRGSASPHVVGKWAVKEAVDPEEMLVAAASSCHMLAFLHVAREAGFVATSYRDHAEGVMGDIAPGRQAVTAITLHPRIEWRGAAPNATELAHMHHKAHQGCYIANSIRTEITVS